MVNCLDVHSFILSLLALCLMLQFDAVLELTPFLKFRYGCKLNKVP